MQRGHRMSSPKVFQNGMSFGIGFIKGWVVGVIFFWLFVIIVAGLHLKWEKANPDKRDKSKELMFQKFEDTMQRHKEEAVRPGP
jgi:hypothetical protein